MKNQSLVLANLGMLFVTVIWGSTYIVIKNCITDVTILPFFFYRFLIAAFMTGIILLVLRKNPIQNLKNGAILGLLFFSALMTQTLALNIVSATNTGFICGLFVFFVPIFNFLIFRKKSQKNIIIPSVLVCIGLWNMTGGIHEIGYGELLALLSTILFALYILYIDVAVKSSDIWVLNFQQFTLISLVCFFLALIFSSSFAVTTLRGIQGIAYLSIVASVLTLAIQFKAQKTILPFYCALILSLEPIFATIFARILGQEILTLRTLVSGLLIFSAILMVQLRGKGLSDRPDTSTDQSS